MGQELTDMSRRQLQAMRRNMQIVFQDPMASLDPRMTVSSIMAEPLRIHRTTTDVRDRVAELLEMVGLHPQHGNRYPHEFSGGGAAPAHRDRPGPGPGTRPHHPG